MKYHTEVYYEHFGYTTADCVLSEISGRPAVAIHHIQRRGRGGDDSLDRIENLMALTWEEHEKYGDKKQYKAWLYILHKKRLDTWGKPYDKEWLEQQISKHGE